MLPYLIVLATASLLFVAGIVKVAGSRRLTARATGEIVGHRAKGKFYAVFRFTVPGRGEFEVSSDIGWSVRTPARGTIVDVVYDPEDPRRARIDRWPYSGAFVGGVLIAIGLVFIATVLALLA
jgi:hypothetical protein